MSTFTRQKWLGFGVVAMAIALASFTQLAVRSARATSDYMASICAPGQSCNTDCVEGYLADAVRCPGSWACALWYGPATEPATPTYQVCIPGTQNSNCCYMGSGGTPFTCPQPGSGYFCSCRSLTLGDCNLNNTFCSCFGTATYTVTYTFDGICSGC